MNRQKAADKAVVAICNLMAEMAETATDAEWRDIDIVATDFFDVLIKYASPEVAAGMAAVRRTR